MGKFVKIKYVNNAAKNVFKLKTNIKSPVSLIYMRRDCTSRRCWIWPQTPEKDIKQYFSSQQKQSRTSQLRQHPYALIHRSFI